MCMANGKAVCAMVYCVSVRPAVPPGTEVSRRCVDNGATTGAGSDGELGPQVASRKAGYADLGRGGFEQEGRICQTWAEEWELPRAEPKDWAWSMAV